MMGATKEGCFFTPTQMGKMHRALSITSAQKYVDPSGCPPPPKNMVLWLPFNETAGNSAVNAAGGNNGMQFGSPTITTPGKVGNALCFNGSNQYVDVLSYNAVNFPGALSDFSIDAWVKRPANSGNDGVRVIVEKRTLVGSVLRGYVFYLYNGVIGLQLANGVGYTNYNAGAVGGLGWIPDDDKWYHVAATVRRNSTTGLQFYRNGEPYPTAFNTVPRNGFLSNSARFRVGARTAVSPGDFFHGCIDEVEAFRRVLTPNEVKAIYNAGSIGKCKLFCHLPTFSTFCHSDNFVNVTAEVCNFTSLPQAFMYWFEGLPIGPGIPLPAGCDIEGPMIFTPCSDLITVGPGVCAPVSVQIERPVDMTAASLIGCYQLQVQALGNTNDIDKFSCQGSVLDGRDLCGIPHIARATGSVGNPVNIGPVTVTNTTGVDVSLDYEFVVMADDMNPDTQAVSLNGLPPGTPVTGILNLGPGESTEIDLSAEFVEYDPLHFYTVLMQADVDSDGMPDPLTSISLRNVIPPGSPCATDADCDDGLFCNGVETCDPAADQCQDGDLPCSPDQMCNEETDTCEDVVIPTVSEWGLVILTLLLLAGAKIYFGLRRTVTA